jgi:hypothetical protein
VTRKSYNGDVEKIDPLFRRLLDAYAREIFSRELEVRHFDTVNVPNILSYN